MYDLLKLFASEPWAVKIGIILALALVINVALYQILRQIARFSKRTRNSWDDTLVKAVALPAYFAIWLVALKYCFDVITLQMAGKVFVEANLALRIAVVVCIARFLLKLIKLIALNFIRAERGRDHTTIDAFAKLASLVVIVVTVLSIMQGLGFNVSGLVAAGGVGGVVIGFAAKDMIANLFGGLTIYLDRPFGVGDWVRCNEKGIEGTVEHIGWRHTRLRAFNKNPIYVPNAIFTTVVVENPSRMTNRRLEQIIGLRYCDVAKMRQITAEVKNLLDNHEKIDQNQKRIVSFMNFGASSLDFKITSYSTITEWEEFNMLKQEILLDVAEIIEKNGAEVAFPTRTVFVEK